MRANFLISIREDALASLDRFKAGIPGLFDNFLRVEPLGRVEAREAIVGPIDHYNERVAERHTVTIERDLVDAVLTELAARDVIIGAPARGAGTPRETATDAVEAPFLQMVMTRLWTEELGSGSRILRRSTLRPDERRQPSRRTGGITTCAPSSCKMRTRSPSSHHVAVKCSRVLTLGGVIRLSSKSGRV